MADSDLELDKMGGRFNAEQGQIFTAQDVDRIGGFAVKSLLNFLAILFFDEANGVPLSGFPRDQLTTDMCKVSATGDLSFTVSTGWGMFYDSSAAADEFQPTRYLPVVLDTAYSASLDAHDATHPRIDLVCIAPAWEDDQPETRNVKNPSTGVVTSSSIDARRRFSAAVLVVKGTAAASPSPPAVPSGYMEVARGYVPATSGAVTWKDHRAVLQVGQWLSAVPHYYSDDFVPEGGSGELEVTATSPASLAIDIERGRATINGLTRMYRRADSVALTAAHATLDRIDLIVAQEDGSIDIVDGTPAASPIAPSVPADTVPLAEVLVEAAVTSVSNAKITDRRTRAPFNHSRLQTPEVFVELGTPVVVGDEAEIPVALFYPDGLTEYTGPFDAAGVPALCAFEVELFELVSSLDISGTAWSGSDATSDFTAGTLYLQRFEPAATYATIGADATYLAELCIVWFKPTGKAADGYNQGGGPGYSGKTQFWCPGRTGSIKITRASGGRAGDYLVRVRPINRPGGCTPNVVVSFT